MAVEEDEGGVSEDFMASSDLNISKS